MGSRPEPGGDSESAESTDERAGTALQRAEFDWTKTEPSVAAVLTVAAALDRDPEWLSPLDEAIDPDALDAVVGGRSPLDGDGASVSFRYDGVDVTVTGSGAVTVDRRAE